MRLPFLQVNQEIFDVLAPALSVLLEIGEGDAALHLLRLWKCLVDTGTEERPPDGVIRGEKAAALIERAVRWGGQPGAFVQACQDPSLCLIEVVPGGLRIRGAERYQAAWRKANASRERAAEWRRARSEPEQNAHGTRTERAPNALRTAYVHPETQTQTQTQIDLPSEDRGSPSAGPQVGRPTEKPEPTPPGTDGRQIAGNGPPCDEPGSGGGETGVNPEGDKPSDLQALWNELAHPSLPRWREMTVKRRSWATARLRERSVDEYRPVLERINASAFCLGGNDRGWRADVEFFLRPDTPAKVLEGKYDARPGLHRGRAPESARDWSRPIATKADGTVDF